MKKLLLFAFLAIAALASAQEKRFVIKGEMSSPVLCYSNETVTEVKLEQDVDGQRVEIATAPVVDNKFTIEGIAPDVTALYYITGFDNGTISIFLEEGEITVGPFDAAYPVPYSAVGQPSGLLLGIKVDQLIMNGNPSDAVVAFAPHRIGADRGFRALAGGMA